MPKVTIYHNPRCSKSRQTLELLRENAIEPEIIEYLQNPPSANQLKKLAKLLQLSPQDLIRRNEAEYKEQNIDQIDSDAELFSALSRFPKLIQRPIVVIDDQAVIGRPPENILRILP